MDGWILTVFLPLFVGEKVIKRLTVQNISKEPFDVSFLQENLNMLSEKVKVKCKKYFSLTFCKLRSSLLDIHGPFSLLNAMRGINPGEKHTFVLAFCPTLEKKVGQQFKSLLNTVVFFYVKFSSLIKKKLPMNLNKPPLGICSR